MRAFARIHWPLGVVLVVALAMRWINLFPVFFYGDAAEYAIVARSLSEDPRMLTYPDLEGFGTNPFVSQPPLLLYLFALAGRLVGNVETGAVLVSVLLGAATCGLVYAIGVHLQGCAMGTLAGLVLAVLPPHVSLSRKALLDVGLTFFMTLAILCFLLWTSRRTTRWSVATGLAAAAAVFSKLPGVLIVVPLGVGVLYALWQHAHRPLAAEAQVSVLRVQAARRADLRHATWALVPVASLGTIYLLLVWYLRASRNLFEKLGWQFGRVAAGDEGVGSRPDPPWHWYLTDGSQGLAAQFGPIVVILVLVGLGLAIWQAWKYPSRRPALLVLLAWPLSVLLFFTLSSRKEGFYLLPLSPAIALLVAWPFGPARAAIERVLARAPAAAARPGARTAALLALAILVAVLPPAVVAMEESVLTERSYGYGVKEAAAWIHENDPDAAQVGTLLGRFTLKFYNDQTTYHWFVPHHFVESEIEAGRVRYVVWDDYLNLTYERDWMRDLVIRYGGEVVQTFVAEAAGPDRVRVTVYELHPSSSEPASST